MREIPILFNGAMVRAILAGEKTQTRRIGKPVRHPDLGNLYTLGALVLEHEPQHVIERACPYGRPGDRLWVRETWQGPLFDIDQMRAYAENSEPFKTPDHCVYAADGAAAPEFVDADDNLRCGWRPSIHMPRWACRILLEVVSVRVERLQDISEADARAEGTDASHCFHDGGYCKVPEPYKTAFAGLWAGVYGADNWRANPWVWVVEFRRVEAPQEASHG